MADLNPTCRLIYLPLGDGTAMARLLAIDIRRKSEVYKSRLYYLHGIRSGVLNRLSPEMQTKYRAYEEQVPQFAEGLAAEVERQFGLCELGLSTIVACGCETLH